MMDCIMRFLRKIKHPIIFLIIAVISAFINAEEKISVSLLALNKEKNTAYVDFDQSINLTPELMTALKKGIVLKFEVRFLLIKQTKFWFDKTILEKTATYQIKYKNLIQQYESSNIKGEKQYFNELRDGINYIENVRHWNVGIIDNSNDYVSMVLKIRLDRGGLPKPIQLNMDDDMWNIQSLTILDMTGVK